MPGAYCLDGYAPSWSKAIPLLCLLALRSDVKPYNHSGLCNGTFSTLTLVKSRVDLLLSSVDSK